MEWQCAPVNFVAGSNATLGQGCKNASDFNAEWTHFSGFVGEKPKPTGNVATHLLASASASASSTSAGLAAAVTGMGNMVAGLGMIAAGIVL